MSGSLDIEFPEKFAPLFGQHRYQVYYGGRGGAKSWACARALLIIGLQRKLRVLCTREFQSSIADSVHRLLADQIAALGLTDHYTVLQNEIRGANGTEFLFKGLRRNVQEIKSTEAIDICWVEEAANVSDESWEVLIPTVRNAGSQIWVTFNPRFKNDPTFQRFVVNPPPNAVVVKVGWQDNPWFPEELHAEMEHLKATDYDEYLHVWEGEFKQFADGSIYAKQLRKAREDGRICRIPVESMVEVHTFWDLGRNDATAIWFMQRIGPEHRFIDYYENRLVDLEHYVRVLKEKGYNYGRHFLPHDVEVELLGMRNTRKDQLESAGVKPIEVVPRIGHINEGIEMTRQKFPSCWFDEERCERGLEALAAYQYVYDDVHGTHRQHPLHNWASNGCLVAGTLVATSRGEVPIESVKIGDFVKTPWGMKRVLNSGMTKFADELIRVESDRGDSLTMTPEHKIYANGAFIHSDALRQFDKISVVSNADALSWKIIKSLLSFAGISTGFREAITGLRSGAEAKAFCTEQSGQTPMGQYLTGIMSTISTTIPVTTASITSYALVNPSIFPITQGSALGSEAKQTRPSFVTLLPERKSGTPAKLELSGTQNTASEHGKTESESHACARNADASLKPRIRREQSSVLTRAKTRSRRALQSVTTKIALALCAAVLSAFTATQKRGRVVKIARLDMAGKSVPVYDLTVEDDRCYYANGFLVSNSDAFRQFAQGFHGSSVWGAPKLPMSERRSKLVQTRFKQSTKWRV